MTPYYADNAVTLYHGDCREVAAWLEADVLVTDPPYGRAWASRKGAVRAARPGGGWKASEGIANDKDTGVRDAALAAWGQRPAVVFGDPLIPAPAGAVQALVYAKPLDAGIKGARAGFRRDIEMVYLVGPWNAGVGGRTSVLRTGALVAGPRGLSVRYQHPHAKPVDVMADLVAMAPGVVADPFAGSGSTLTAAKMLGRKVIGVELSEAYCEIAANRLSQDVLDFGESA